MIKVSVIVAIYNTKTQYLKECLNSLKSQTYKNLDIILIDDGSEDYIKDLCTSCTADDSRFRYFFQKNSGCSVARNNGLKKAIGDYVLFVDHDDTLRPDYIELLVKKISYKQDDFCLMSWFTGRKIEEIGTFITFAALIKKSFLIANPDVCFPSGIQPCEDGIFSHKLLALTQKGCIEDKAVYYWRNYDEQTTAITDRQTEKILNAIPKWLEILEKFYTEHRLFKTKGRHLLRFLEDEPFSLRLEKMPFSLEQKEMLASIIYRFVEKYNLKTFIDNTFSKRFILFLNSSSYTEYQKNIKKEHKRNRPKILFLTLLKKLAFCKKWRRKLKHKIQMLK